MAVAWLIGRESAIKLSGLRSAPCPLLYSCIELIRWNVISYWATAGRRSTWKGTSAPGACDMLRMMGWCFRWETGDIRKNMVKKQKSLEFFTQISVKKMTAHVHTMHGNTGNRVQKNETNRSQARSLWLVVTCEKALPIPGLWRRAARAAKVGASVASVASDCRWPDRKSHND